MHYKVTQLRREVGLTQYELAEAAKLPRYKVQLLEQGISCMDETEITRVLKIVGLKFDRSIEWMAQLVDTDAGGTNE